MTVAFDHPFTAQPAELPVAARAGVPVKRIVVVDDELHVQRVLRLKLVAAGYDVRTYGSAMECLDALAADRPDLIIADFHMPKMNGLELARLLHESPATAYIPVVMITSHPDLLSNRNLVTPNIRLLLDKPFSPRQVISIARELLATS